MHEGDLSRADFHSPTWARLRLKYEARLDMLRRRNDGVLTLEETVYLRGQIAECKQLLGLERAPEQAARGQPLTLET